MLTDEMTTKRRRRTDDESTVPIPPQTNAQLADEYRAEWRRRHGLPLPSVAEALTER